MPRWVCLDVCCGLGGFSAAFEESDEWDVVTVDIEERFAPDVCADVMDLRPSDLLEAIGEYDRLVVLASPPCTDFSPVAWSHEQRVTPDGEPVTDDARESVALVYHTLGLIKSLAPDYWYMENPRGALRWVIGKPTAHVDYCAYGHYTRKPTDIWGDHAPMEYRRCPHDTHTREDGVTDFELGPSDASERAELPYGLSESIREAVGGAFRGEPVAAEQATVGEF